MFWRNETIAYLCRTKINNNQTHNTMKQANNFQTTSEQIAQLGIGEALAFPAEKLHSVRVTAYNLGFQLDRLYKTHADRKERVIVVIRMK